MNGKQNDMLMQIIVVSSLVSLFSISKAGFLGVYIIFIAFILMFYINASSNDVSVTWTTLFDKTSQIIATIFLLFFYIFFCIVRYKEFIIDDQMPTSWYTFSYLILIILLFHGYVIRRTLEGNQSYWCGIAMLLNVMLFVCIFFSYISSRYFRTDGFHV
jgi:hypothetical protein